MISPGILNPDSFDSKDELRAALKKQGEDRGWTRIDEDDTLAQSDADKGRSFIQSLFSKKK